MWWKSKFVLFSLCLELMFLTFFTFDKGAKAAGNSTNGFIIEADRVIGNGMTASIVKQETSSKDGQPMLRIQYKSATIYGMKLTKEVNSPKGPLSITLKANGPVTVINMTVDTTAITFQGACLKASDTVPEIGMEHVVMVAHFMNSGDSDIENLILNTVSGDTNAPRPGKLKILQDLSLLPVNQLDNEIKKISSGHFPLTCVDESKQGQSGPIGVITNPIKDVVDITPLDPVLKPLEPVLTPLNPVLKPLDPVLKPLDPVLKPLDPVLKPLDPVLKPVEPVLKQIDPVLQPVVDPVVKAVDPVIKATDPVVKSTTETVNQSINSACTKLSEANGVITKELALNLIDEAINKKLSFTTVCQNDSNLTSELQKWEGTLLKSLGLVDIFGKLIPVDPMQELNKFRDKISTEPDGTVLFKP
jgi:hypothetical protein